MPQIICAVPEKLFLLPTKTFKQDSLHFSVGVASGSGGAVRQWFRKQTGEAIGTPVLRLLIKPFYAISVWLWMQIHSHGELLLVVTVRKLAYCR